MNGDGNSDLDYSLTFLAEEKVRHFALSCLKILKSCRSFLHE